MDIAESAKEGREDGDRRKHRRAGRVRDICSLARPAHWTKTLLVVPLALLDPAAWSGTALERVGWAVVVFVLASMLVYLVNDTVDRRLDRLHATKRNRPLAAGRVSFPLVVSYGLVVTSGFGVLVLVAPHGTSWPVFGYLLLNVAYSCGLKHSPLLDIGAVSAGFVLRAVQGYVAAGIHIAGWLLLTIFAGSLLLLLGKRRRELLEVGAAHRPSLRGYTVELTNHLLLLTGVLCLTSALAYLLTEAPIAPHRQAAMLISAPFALYAISRYLQVVLVMDGGGDPVKTLLRDRALVVAVALWAVTLGAFFAMNEPAAISAIRSWGVR
ncbi:UbiA prenyltransferase family protein [Actinomadura sp. 7K534]|uniref:UbiA prenyltransferase family protein n=1 Tax=Actinomadura sp. 7K534 TaxID=2530366 RepID=UPI001042E1A1|nr:UbiA prenyltransferase family protein [Actinomadura sp. 7K534]TDB94047.1 prenyltransferase [Actinomadura sp. 7K534]